MEKKADGLVARAEVLAGVVREELKRPMAAAMLPGAVKLAMEAQAALLVDLAERVEQLESYWVDLAERVEQLESY